MPVPMKRPGEHRSDLTAAAGDDDFHAILRMPNLDNVDFEIPRRDSLCRQVGGFDSGAV